MASVSRWAQVFSVIATPGRAPFQESRATRGYVTSREDRVYCLAELGHQQRLLQDRSVTVCFRSASCSVAANKEKRQATLGDDLGDGADAVTADVYVENGKIKNSHPCQSDPISNIARLSNHAMPKLVDHFGEHPSDQGFIFYQEYGCFGHFSPPEKRWVLGGFRELQKSRNMTHE